ncbi:acetyl-CoA synthetase-like protein [Schizopora paradoxa]|uniref:Acetyl-CoA synthetase-like protein n=1 Tax=Schizopora paradoxa TaxID=27342 RepID=A0A0H2RKY2_9AGAM|nr:acetyl-CoA synthetase-like protein [Schizopora paradoxa]
MTLPIPPPPNTQALTCPDFRPPPLDGSLTYPELFDWHLTRTPNHPIFVYSDDLGAEHRILWPEGARGIQSAARIVRQAVDGDEDVAPERPTVVAILSTADTFTFFAVLVGIVRAGHTAFPISVRNSPQAVAYLLEKTKATHMLLGSEPSIKGLAEESFECLAKMQNSVPKTFPMPVFGDLFRGKDWDNLVPLSFKRPKMEDAAIILHSSGSTAFPKPITWTHYRMLQLAVRPCNSRHPSDFGERDLCGLRLASHSVPMFHGMGMMLTGWTASVGLVLSSFRPQTPAMQPTPETVMRGAIHTKSDIIFCVPTFIETWSRQPECVRHLKSIDGVVFSGGPLNKAVGDALTAEGISIFMFFGCTESGIYNNMFPKSIGKDWDYFDIAECVNTKFIPDGFGNAELVVLPNNFVLPCVLNSEFDGAPAYASKDLLTPHPSKPGYWRVFGRVDDQIMHSTGEKTNPGPLETILNQDPHIQSVVIFGRGRFYAGVVVDPKPELRFDPMDGNARVTFRNKIWPSVERMNNFAPQHSRIFKEMILVSKPSKPFTYTAKNTARRQAIINTYDTEINELYKEVEETSQPDADIPLDWTTESTILFVRSIVVSVLRRTLGDDDDLFQMGCDSLQATWIRNTLLNALRKSTEVDTRGIPMNFIYEYPTISMLSNFIQSLTHSGNSETLQTKGRVEAMHEMVSKYSEEFPMHRPSRCSDARSGECVVLLTGSTGGLGSTILSSLIECPDVSCVYALNRKGNLPLEQRQRKAIVERAIDLSLLSCPKLVLLEGDLDQDGFGLSSLTFGKIKNRITHIIHNAYSVNFNLSLPSFEKNVTLTRRLVDLALSSPSSTPPRFLFTSSVGVLRNYGGDGPVVESPVGASSAIGSGYSESKWVCEQVLMNAVEKTTLTPVIIRVGQLCGSSKNGFWTTKEWVPAIFKSGAHTGSLPDLDGDVSWLPVDIAGKAIVEMRDSDTRILHLAHPKPVSWTSIFQPASNLLGVPLVPYDLWLQSLKESSSSSEAENTAIHLIEFFESIATQNRSIASGRTLPKDAMGLPAISLTQALKESIALRECAEIQTENIERWLTSAGLVLKSSNLRD